MIRVTDWRGGSRMELTQAEQWGFEATGMILRLDADGAYLAAKKAAHWARKSHPELQCKEASK